MMPKHDHVKQAMGSKHVLHPDYDIKKNPWHATHHKTSYHLAAVQARAIAEGRL